MLADKPHGLNGRPSVQRICVLTILPPVTALTVGLPAQRAIAQRFRAMARNRHGRMSESSPPSGLEQKSNFGAVRRKITFVLGFQSSCSNGVARRLDKPTAKLSARIS